MSSNIPVETKVFPTPEAAMRAKIRQLQSALEFIAGLAPGSRGAYGKFKEAQERAREALR